MPFTYVRPSVLQYRDVVLFAKEHKREKKGERSERERGAFVAAFPEFCYTHTAAALASQREYERDGHMK